MGCSKFLLWLQLWFELNQSGIETNSVEERIQTAITVWIEPKWNWDPLPFLRKFPYLLLLFELNQSGIETNSISFVDTASKYSVWIEPKWNWDVNTYEDENNNNQSLNWTKVELRHIYVYICLMLSDKPFELNQSGIETELRKRIYLPSGRVWIEPKWNWDGFRSPLFLELSSFMFELNQSGIETAIVDNYSDGPNRLNWTKVELRHGTSRNSSNTIKFQFELNQSGIET